MQGTINIYREINFEKHSTLNLRILNIAQLYSKPILQGGFKIHTYTITFLKNAVLMNNMKICLSQCHTNNIRMVVCIFEVVPYAFQYSMRLS